MPIQRHSDGVDTKQTLSSSSVLFDLSLFLSQFLTDPKNDLVVIVLSGIVVIKHDIVKMKIDIAKICQWKDDHEKSLK